MYCKLATILIITNLVKSEDKKWVWGDNSRNAKPAADLKFGKQAASRYEVFEDDGRPIQSDYIPSGPAGIQDFSPGYPNRPGGGFGNRPISSNRPGAELFTPNERPGGLYGNGNINNGGYGQGNYGGGGFSSGGNDHPGILTGPVPSWVQEGPFKKFDHCKCAEKFNCNSPGISYGHCDVGKQYCCYSSKKNALGGPNPSRPIHSPENGILVGPGGPVDGNYGRPGRPNYDGPNRPFNRPDYQRPGNGFGLGGGRPDNYGPGPISNRPIHSPENGILVGPGGPFDNHGGFRSAKKH